MNAHRFPLLVLKDQAILQDALHYMQVAELKQASLMLSLPDTGKKTELIERILVFIKEGQIKTVSLFPAQSRAKNYPFQALSLSSLILHGSYKNDLKTRNFFKQLIGPHFHFTAFGIDWLNNRWLQGKPPTYQEFADFWIQETHRRKQEGTTPKDEWMFIRFIQKMKKEEPASDKEYLMEIWKQLQKQKAKEGFQLVDKAAKVLK